jgi:hypothetical protein
MNVSRYILVLDTLILKSITMNQKEYMRYNFEEGLYKAYDSRNPLSTVLSPPGTS